MVCSEKELGLSNSHEGIILMHDQPRAADGTPFAPGTPAADVLGDIVFDIELTPNLARALSVVGVAREIASLYDLPLRPPSNSVVGPSIEGRGHAVNERAGTQPALHAHAAARHKGRAVAGVDAAPPATRRSAPDRRHRGRDQLRHVRDGPAAARFRL